MRKRERLSLYKKALHDWINHPNDICNCTHNGLCAYFQAIYGIDVEDDLPELWAQKPKRPKLDNEWDKQLGYWYDRGNNKGRIQCLKKAIALCEDKGKYTVQTKEGRLRIYKETLEIYKNPHKNKRLTEQGICGCIWNKMGFDLFYTIEDDLPELAKTKPKIVYDQINWFKPGEIHNRIKCLEKAIALCK